MPDGVVYSSHVRVERVAGSTRHAFLPAEQEPVLFSVHDEIAQHYGRPPGTFEPHAATLDYMVAATAG